MTSSSSKKAKDVIVERDGVKYKKIEEGQAHMYYKVKDDNSQEVFYNPVQVQNRDLSILMISLFAERRAKRVAEKLLKKHQNKNKDDPSSAEKTVDDFLSKVRLPGMRILDALAASGLRSIRYLKECYVSKEFIKASSASTPEGGSGDNGSSSSTNDKSFIGEIVVNDLDPAAVEQAHENIKFNDADATIIKPHCGDALDLMYRSRAASEKKFDVIDLDPYGSAAPFLDAAVQGVANGGMLCVTCTDMVVLGGSHPETCFGRYRSMPMPNGRYLQELALRILLQTIEAKANTYGRSIRPILSVGMAFYVRVFVEVHDDKAAVVKSSLNIGHVYQSAQCPSFFVAAQGMLKKNNYVPSRGPPASVCEETGAEFKIAGPIWLGPLHNFSVVDEAIKRLENDISPFTVPTKTRMHGLLSSVSEELSDVPLYYKLPDLCKTLHCANPPMDSVKAALINAGYRVSGQHKEPQALKTNAPNRFIWDMLRVWIKDHPVSEKHLTEGSTAQKILSVEPVHEVDFTVPKDFAKRKKACRFPMNPEKNWGPKPRATGKRKAQDTNDTDNVDSVPPSKK
mmetsp:Transcript_18145/g.26963  ORF Transcript_18145/g.26963 Transcript_18145/m.26963 type:complete len:568 (-) Transcript_18145:785-2488(-)